MSAPAYILSVRLLKGKKLFEIRNIVKFGMIAGGIFLSLRYAEECAQGIRKGILFCIEALVPSLFLLMALSAYLVKSGVMRTFTQPLKKISHALFRLPPQGMAVILLGMIGGYPVGARCAAMLYTQGELSEIDAKKTAYIAVCAGPGFLMNYVGGALLHNRSAGMLLLVSEIIGVILTGVFIGRILPSGADGACSRCGQPAGSLLTASVADASLAVFRMCGMVVIGTAVIEVIATVCPDTTIVDLAAVTIEITEGCHRMCGVYPLTLIAFFIGFGGISVHLQIFAGMEHLTVNKGLFFWFRIIQGIITAALTYILLMIFPVKQSVFNSTDAPLTLSHSATLVGSAALVLSSLCFLGSIRQKTSNKP